MGMVKDFIAKNGVTQCAPAHAQGNEAKQGLRKHVSRERKAWAAEAGVTLGVGMVKQEAA